VRWHFRLPRVFASTVEAGPMRAAPILDGRCGTVPNVWQLPPYTVALIGRPAVWFSFDVSTPRIGPIPPKRLVWEQDFGGHLFLAVTRADPASVSIVEGGPSTGGGTGALVPFCYPEDDFTRRGVVDFEPVLIPPPNALTKEAFCEMVLAAQRSYDGDQSYLAVEIQFLRIGRDSNSYAIGILLACGVDVRAIPKPVHALRFEWVGYPGAEDPVHRANFGAYLGAPAALGDGVVGVAYHDAAGDVLFVVVGGHAGDSVRLPDGTPITLDNLGRAVLSRDDALRHGLPVKMTPPPEHIRNRRRFPKDPSPAGAMITLILDGHPVPLQPGEKYRGSVVDRHDALALAKLRTQDGRDVVLPLVELGVELRDPKRVDALFHVGNEVTLGLHRDRRPKLIAHGPASVDDKLTWHRFHAPPWGNVFVTSALGLVAVAIVVAVALRRR